MGGDTVPVPLLTADYDEFGPAIAPDGRWLAYTSDETGQFEVFVRPFPEVDQSKVQISSGGARGAVWSPDGRELYYVTNGPTTGTDRQFMAAELRPGPPMAVLSRRVLFEVPDDIYFANYTTSVDITPDGERFLMGRVASLETPDRRRFVVVKNWFTEIKERLR
jgi:Tol biopolymer transport system component